MKKLLIISLLLINVCYGQRLIVNGHRHAAAPAGFQRILIDLGGNGVGDHANFADVGIMTPDNTDRRGQDANGKWWNNITNGYPGTLLSDPIDTANNVITGLSIAVDVIPRGTFGTPGTVDSSMNFAGWTSAAVGDYPVTATRDNLYFHFTANGGVSNASPGVVNMTFVIPAGKVATIKFWGSRVTGGVGPPRILQFKKSTDGSYTDGYDAEDNSSYTGYTMTGITGSTIINIRTKPSVSDLGAISVIDIKLEDE